MTSMASILSNCTSAIQSHREWRQVNLGTVLCPTCKRLDRSRWFPKPVDLVITDIPPKRAMGTAAFTSILVLRADLLEELQKLRGDGVVGTVRDQRGYVRERFRTLYFEDYIVVRGAVPEWVCGGCGLRTAGNRGEDAWVSAKEVGDRSVVQTASGTLYIRSDLVGGLGLERWPDLYVARTCPLRAE